MKNIVDFNNRTSEILNEFNWERVHDVMVFIKQEWYFGKIDGRDVMGIPSIDVIKSSALRLLEIAYNEEGVVSSGGFKASYLEDNLCLEFILETWDV